MPRGGDDRYDALAHPAQVQARSALEWAERVANAAGASGPNIVRAQWFMADATQFAGVQLAWASRYGNAPHPFVCVQPPAPLPAPSAALTADFWIYAP
jgi:enamine deaminase RidA (YjgF/YER057c/UK114 family)